jgi:hypothetical protein
VTFTEGLVVGTAALVVLLSVPALRIRWSDRRAARGHGQSEHSDNGEVTS